MSEPVRLEVGRIGRAHGLRGEVAVTPISNRPERFRVGSQLYIDDRAVVIVAVRPHQDRWLVRFEGIDDRTAAETVRGRRLYGDPLPDGPDELYVHELIGSEVRDERDGAVLGRVKAVEANPAHDLLVLDDNRLIPIVFVRSSSGGVVTVDVPEGLLDL